MKTFEVSFILKPFGTMSYEVDAETADAALKTAKHLHQIQRNSIPVKRITVKEKK